MSGECCETDTSNESKSSEVKEDISNESESAASSGQAIQRDDDDKLHEMGEALEIAENRCNTLKEQLDQMRQLYRERSTIDSGSTKNAMDSSRMEVKPALKPPMLRQNSEAISTDNSGAAVLTINNILNGITNSINRLSELHTYVGPESNHFNMRKKSKHTKTQENEFVSEKRHPKRSASQSSTWFGGEKKNENRRKNKRSRTAHESGSMTRIKKQFTKSKLQTPREEASTTSVKNRKKYKRANKTLKKLPPRRAAFSNNMSSNHLVELYHNTAVDYADSEEMIQAEQAEQRNQMRVTHSDLRNRHSRREVQMPTISTTNCKEEDDAHGNARPEGYRSLSPIKEQEPNMEMMQQHQIQYPEQYYYNRSYQSPTISSKLKQVARGYFQRFSCKTIPFCAAKSTSPSHNIGINIQQVMSIIKGRQSTQGISPTLAHNIGLAADRLNTDSFSALVSSFGHPCNHQQMTCPMQCNVNYRQLQEMAATVPNDENLDEDDTHFCEKDKIVIEIANRKSQETISWTIDPNTHNNCTCVGGQGVGFQQMVEKYQNIAPPQNIVQNSIFSLQPSVYSQKIQKQASKKYGHIRSVYAQYNETNRKNKRGSLSELSTADGMEANFPLQGKEKILKGVLMNLHEEFQSLSDKSDELSKIVEDEKHSNSDNVEKLDEIEKKLTAKELEIQMVMSLYTEVVNLKAQVKALREKAGMTAAILDVQKHRRASYSYPTQQAQHQQSEQQPEYYNYSQNAYQTIPETKAQKRKVNANAAQLSKLLRQINAYREVCNAGAK